MSYKIIHTLAFDRQFAQHKHLRERMILFENQIVENPYIGIPIGNGVYRILLSNFTLFYSINENTIIMFDIKKNVHENLESEDISQKQ